MTVLAANVFETQIAFSVYENKGVFALLLGSGLSRAAQIPTGWEITLDLIRRMALAQGSPDRPDWAQWYRESTGEEPNYPGVLERLTVAPSERRAILESYIEPSARDRAEGRKLPTKAHHAIAALVAAGYVRVIITTNFDRLLENALRERGIEPTVVASPDALEGAEPFAHSKCYLLKVHGDYKDARILNTDEELNEYPSAYAKILDRIFDDHGLIVAGWSAEWDRALCSAIARTPNRRYPIYWTTRGELGTRATDLINHRRARVVPIADADQFFVGLQQRVETLQQTHQQNPNSVELLVESSKRYLSRAEFRIPLEELFRDQVSTLAERLEAENAISHKSVTVEEFTRRARSYEAMTEALARMVGALGRWGNDGEIDLAIDVIRSAHAISERAQNGNIVWLALRSYPAVLLLTAYGLGLTRSQRWATLHQVFAAEMPRERGTTARLIDTLFLWGWKGGDTEYWKHFDGLQTRKTPLSDRLCELFRGWSTSFAGLTPDFEIVFERFELLASLAFLEPLGEVRLSKALEGEQGVARMPLGRVKWDAERRARLVRELQVPPTREAYLQAQFGQGSATFIDLFIKNLSRLSSAW